MKPKKWIRNTILLCLVFLAVLFALYLLRLSDNLRRGVNRVIVSRATSDKKQDDLLLESRYFDLEYPTNYYIKSIADASEDATSESTILIARDIATKKIAIIMQQTAEASLEEIPSYKYRLINPNLYTKSQCKLDASDCVLFERNAKINEKTVFVHRGGYALIISLTSGATDGSIDKDFEIITKHFKWK